MSDSLPNHEKFTWSTTMDVFAESPNRVFLVQKGELARIDKRPETKWVPEFGPGLVFPVFRLPLRQAGAGAGSNPLDPPADGKAGVDWRWEHCIVVVDADGKIIEDWTQWDKLFTRPHDVEISPYDPEKNVWVVDAEGHCGLQVQQRRQEAAADAGHAARARARTTRTSTVRPSSPSWMPTRCTWPTATTARGSSSTT